MSRYTTLSPPHLRVFCSTSSSVKTRDLEIIIIHSNTVVLKQTIRVSPYNILTSHILLDAANGGHLA